MTASDESPPRPTPARPPRSGRDERAERLAAELRANLRRRKDQSRGRRDADADPDGETTGEDA